MSTLKAQDNDSEFMNSMPDTIWRSVSNDDSAGNVVMERSHF